MSLIVAGATGAIGREVVAEAVNSDAITRIVALSRSSIPEADWAAKFPTMDVEKAKGKLQVVGVDWEKLAGPKPAEAPAEFFVEQLDETQRAAFGGHTLAAMCMGTTRKDAGGATGFKRVDLDYVTAFCRAVKQINPTLEHFAQVSSDGAKSNSWFLYMSTKGKADEVAVSQDFKKTSIYRPGLLGRKDKARTVEKVLSALFVPTMAVETVGKAMVKVMTKPEESWASLAVQPMKGPREGVTFWHNGAICDAASKL